MTTVVSKSEIMNRVIHGGAGIIRAHECFAEENLGTFDITTMRERAYRGEYGEEYEAPLTQKTIQWIKSHRDWEPMRVWELMNNPVAPWLYDPGLALLYDDGHLLCDGTHRVIARYALGLRTFLFWACPIEKAPRPPSEMVFTSYDWGKKEITPDGKLRDRK